MGETNKEVVKNQPSEVPAFLAGSDSGFTGFENAVAESFALPFLRILQPQSPQIVEGSDDYVEGAKAGYFLHTGNNEVLGKEVRFIPIMYEPCFIEWEPDGGSFVAKYSFADGQRHKARQDGARWKSEAGNDLMETHQFYGILADYPEMGIIVFSLKSTGIKYSRKWMSKMSLLLMGDGRKAPMFSSVYLMKTALNKNDNNQQWFQIGSGSTLLVERVDWINEIQYAAVTEAIKILEQQDLSGVADIGDVTETISGTSQDIDAEGADPGF